MKILSSFSLQCLKNIAIIVICISNIILLSCSFCVSPKVVTKPGKLVNSNILQLLSEKDVITCIDLDRILNIGFTSTRLCPVFQFVKI